MKGLIQSVSKGWKYTSENQIFSGVFLLLGLTSLCLALAFQLGKVIRVALPEFSPSPINQPSFSTRVGSPHHPESCKSVVELVHWSEKKMGRKHVIQEVRDKAINQFMDKVDPRRILFLAEEVDAFQKEAKRAWPSLVSKGNCDFFMKWHATASHRVKSRFEALLSRVTFEAGEAQPQKDVQFQDWAKGETELRRRLSEMGNAILNDTPEALLAVYGDDDLAVVRDSLEDALEGLDSGVTELLSKSILKGMDKYSTFFSSEEFQDFYADLSGGASGLGIRVRKAPNGIFIEKVLKDSSAERSANVFAGDVITQINGAKLSGMSFVKAKQLLKGPEGSSVSLSLDRKGKHRNVSLTRRPFALEESTVTGKWIKSGNQSVAVISIPSFYGRGGMGFSGNERSSFEDVEGVLQDLYSRGESTAPLVLDLRGNPGGYLEEAVSISSLFVGNQPVVGVSEQNNTRILKDDVAMPLRPEGPMVVLVDEDTASASEVLAGALKDYQKAFVVGTPTTYGKGSVQKLFHLCDPILQVGITDGIGSGVVKLTTSVFYSPLGHTPMNGGVKSQVVIKKSATEKFEDSSEVPDLAPLVDDAVLSMLRSNTSAMELKVASLQQNVNQRQKQMNRTSTDSELSEAIAVAVDVASTKLLRPSRSQ